MSQTVSRKRLDGFCESGLYYSLKISERIYPDSPAQVFSKRLISIFYPFSRLIFKGKYQKQTWNELFESLEGDSSKFKPMPADLLQVATRLEPVVLEKRIFEYAKANLRMTDIYGLSQFMDSSSHADELLSSFDDHLIRIHGIGIKEIAPVAEKFVNAEVGTGTSGLNHRKEYLSLIASELGLKKPSDLQDASIEDPNQSLTKISFQAIGLIQRNMVVNLSCIHSENFLQKGLGNIELDSHKINVVCIFGSEDYVRRLVEARTNKQMAVAIGESDLIENALSPSRNALAEKVRSNLPPRIVSPYKANGAAGETFVGRRDEIDEILRANKCHFAVTGPRRIGKTSLQTEIARLLNEDGTVPSFFGVLVDAQQTGGLQGFQRNIWDRYSEAFKERFPEKELKEPEFGSHFFSEFTSTLRSNQKYGTPVFLIDEVDNVLNNKFQQKVENFFRSLGNLQAAKFVVFGYRTLKSKTKNNDSALHNLFECIELGPLSEPDAIELATEPMKKMGIKYESEWVAGSIAKNCSYFPSLIQLMCTSCLSRLSDKRLITKELVNLVSASEEFEDILLEPVFEDKSMDSLSKMILFSAVCLGHALFTEEELYDEVKKRASFIRLGEFNDAMTYLTQTYRLEKRAGGFRFYVQRQYELLTKHIGRVESQLRLLVRDCREDRELR